MRVVVMMILRTIITMAMVMLMLVLMFVVVVMMMIRKAVIKSRIVLGGYRNPVHYSEPEFKRISATVYSLPFGR